MSDDIKVGDHVSWSSSGGKSVGRVKKKLTQPLEIKGHHVAASPENPELLVQSEKGGEAAHKPASVHKLSGTSPKPGTAGKSTGKSATAKKDSTAKAAPSKARDSKSTAKTAAKKSVAKSAAKK